MATSQTSVVIQQLRRFVFLRDAVSLSDEQLLESFIRSRDEVAFEVLVRRHGAMVMGVCGRVLHSHHDAEDAFQATFLVLARKAAALAARGLVANWLYGVAYNTALKAKASAARRRLREREGANVPKPETAAPGPWQDLQSLLDQELSRLPDKYRAAVVLCDLEGKSRKEAAAQIGCPEGTVASRLGRGRSMLAKRLAQRGVALSAGALAGEASLNIAAAKVSPALIAATSNAAILYATGQALTGVVSTHVATLAEGVLRAMILTKLKTMTVAAMVLGLAAFGGGGMLTRPTSASPLGDQPLVAVAGQPNGNGEQPAKHAESSFPDFQSRFEPMRTQLLEKGGGSKESEDAVALGLAWLVRHQEIDGRWKLDGRFPDKGNANDPAGTALGLLPILVAGKTHKLEKDDPYRLAVDKALRYLVVIQDKQNGSFSRDMYAHGLCTIAFCDAYGMTKDGNLKKPAQAAIDFIALAQHEAGGWRYSPGQAGDTCVTGWQVMALKSALMAGLNVPAATLPKAQNYLDNDALHAQTEGYRYSPEGQPTKTMTAVALLCRQFLQGWDAQNPRMIKGVSTYITPNSPKAEVKDAYFNYYATQVMHAFGGDEWKNWNNKNRNLLIQSQNAEQARPEVWGSWGPAGDQWGQTGGRLMVTSLNLLSLEVYYRYPIAPLPRNKQEENAPKPNVPNQPKPQGPAKPNASLDPKMILEEAIELAGRIKTARSIKPEHAVVRDRALKEIAAVQPDADAFATLNEIQYDCFRAEGLVAIAKRQVAAGQRQQAEETFRKATEAAHRAVDPPGMAQVKMAALRDLAHAQGETGFGAAARTWIDRLESPEERVMALIGLAQGIAVERAKR